MSGSCTVWPAGEADASTLVRFNVRLAVESEGRDLDPTVVELGVRAILSDAGRGRYWIARVDGEPVGQCLVTTEWSDWTAGRYWWLQSVYVAPERRGAGVFGALWRTVVDEARRAGDVRAVRLYVERDNAGAREVYRRIGMRETGYLVYELDLRGDAG